MFSSRTDLAMENLGPGESHPGVEVRRWQQNDIQISEVIVLNDSAAQALGKPIGNYLTLECPLLREHDPDARAAMANLLGEELERMLPSDAQAPILVIGLGNRSVTPDALGPGVIDKTLVTRHISGSFASMKMRSVCAVAPGVLGITGLETMEMVEGIVQKIRPCAVICIDSLAARDSERIGCAIQISNTGIQPGSGVGNHRKPLTHETLGVDVIAVGVPTVIYAATLARDAFALLAEDTPPQEDALHSMEDELLETALGNLIVTPRDIDAIVKNCAIMIAGGLNRALQPNLSEAEIAQMMD